MSRMLDFRASVPRMYPDIYAPAALAALETLAPLNQDRRQIMAARIARRLD